MQIGSSQSLALATVPQPALGGVTNPVTRSNLTMVPGTHFSAACWVHTALAANETIDPDSATIWVPRLLSQMQNLNPANGYYVSVQIYGNTVPIYVVGPEVPTVQIYHDPADLNGIPLTCELSAVPVPADFIPSQGADMEAVIYRPSTNEYWETWLTRKTGRQILNSAGQLVDEWQAGWGGHIPNLRTSPGYFPPMTGTGGDPRCGNYDGYLFGTSATGIAMLAVLMTIEEQQAGVINHPIGMALGWTLGNTWRAPAQRTDGWTNDPTLSPIPQGLRYRFPASLDLTTFGLTPYGLMVAKAIQNHGLYVRETGGGPPVLYAQDYVNVPPSDPYRGPGGIMACNPPYDSNCTSTGGCLANIPWNQLVALTPPPAGQL